MVRTASRSTRDVAALTLAGATAWVGVALAVRGSESGMGASMGLSLVAFLGAWALMMAAMMLPAVAPVASLYVRTMAGAGGARLTVFALGYLGVWALIGLPAFAVALAVDALAMGSPGLARGGVVAVLVALAVYEVTPLKRLCLEHCRSPLSQLLHYSTYRGRLRTLRVGVHHGLACAACCWPMMLLLVAVGTMNLAAMLVLTVVILAEKLLPRPEIVTRVIAGAALVGAILLAISPPLFERMAGA